MEYIDQLISDFYSCCGLWNKEENLSIKEQLKNQLLKLAYLIGEYYFEEKIRGTPEG